MRPWASQAGRSSPRQSIKATCSGLGCWVFGSQRGQPCCPICRVSHVHLYGALNPGGQACCGHRSCTGQVLHGHQGLALHTVPGGTCCPFLRLKGLNPLSRMTGLKSGFSSSITKSPRVQTPTAQQCHYLYQVLSTAILLPDLWHAWHQPWVYRKKAMLRLQGLPFLKLPIEMIHKVGRERGKAVGL